MNGHIYRLGIIEINAVNHGLLEMCRVIKTDKTSVTVFTIDRIYEQAREILGEERHSFEWIVMGKDEKKKDFMKRAERICSERIDLLNIRSLDKDLVYWFFWPKCRLLLWVPQGIFYLMPMRLLGNALRAAVRTRRLGDIRTILSYVLIAMRTWIFVRQSEALYTIDSGVQKWLAENTGYRKKIYALSHAAFEGRLDGLSGRIKFVVPGMIQDIRRDYLLVLRVFEKYLSEYKNEVELCLLGRPVGEYGEKVVSFCEELKSRGYSITYYSAYLSPGQFDEAFRRADVIISPMHMYCGARGKREIYSYSGPAGLVSDTIKYGKPAIVPGWYNIQDEFITSYLSYEDEKGLADVLKSLVIDRQRLENLKKEAVNNSRISYSLEILRGKSDAMVEDILGAVPA
ncbi:MAG: hypothetical protein JXJ19_03135 [Elusimicrobia bacterium]|nr:hypothetical protein [Elusimicrobiota bacterium]